MDDDWDLYAVVRSCKSSATAPSMASAKRTSSSSSEEEGSSSSITTLSCLASLTFEGANDQLSFPKLGEPRTNACQELQQFFFKPDCFFPNPTSTMTTMTTTTTTIATTTRHDNIIPDSVIVDHLGGGGSSGQHQYNRPPNGVVGPAQLISSPQSGFGGTFHVDQQQQVQQQQEQGQNNYQQLVLPRQVQPGFHAPDGMFAPTTLPLQMRLPPNLSSSQNPRSRKRKNQLKKQVRQVTAENLNSDFWAWRKYGQKPIKGSPYPRNYYRCSSSKGCAARKHVERSNVDPDLFIVTYTGDHAHPRPAHRNSLAGGTRAKTTTTTTTAAATENSCSPPQSGTSLSPTTPLSEAQIADEEAASAAVAKLDEDEEEKLGDGREECLIKGEDDEDEENILIPNKNFFGWLVG